MKIETKTADRKAMVKAISEFINEEPHYVGPPSFAYTVGNLLVDRAGAITAEEECDGLKEFLIERGFLEQEMGSMDVSIPMDGMDGTQLKNLMFMLHSKQYLLNKAVGASAFVVSKALVEALENNPPETKEAFLEAFAANTGGCKGIRFSEDLILFIFPMTEDADRSLAYTSLSAAMVSRAKAAKRVSPQEQKPENEKYYFRIWLIQLGFDGENGKAVRKALMAGLKGHSAFRTDADAEKFKADQKAKRAAKRAAQAEDAEA